MLCGVEETVMRLQATGQRLHLSDRLKTTRRAEHRGRQATVKATKPVLITALRASRRRLPY